ncbi:IclR family transcriptional regulator [Gemmobacter lutimaris]|uniref:IclR family transcriptional regulator n=1 Tax=Gemmobacter lutimaris TaxID=2306023 RepID=UPI0011C48EC4|nr:transcriptional regulator [Gemmobacter lutimaris]
MSTATTPERVQTLDRGLQALSVIAARGPIGMATLAQALGVDRRICYRLVATLEAHAFVTRLADGTAILGPGLLPLMQGVHARLRLHGQTAVDALARDTGQTAFLSVAAGEDCLALLASPGRGGLLEITYRVGARHPIGRGAAGIAILSARPPQPDDSAQVMQARRDGWSATSGELQPGAHGVAVPLHAGFLSRAGIEACLGVVSAQPPDLSSTVDALDTAATRLAAQLDGA